MGRAQQQSLWLPFALAILVLALIAATVPLGADSAAARSLDKSGEAGVLASPSPEVSQCEAQLSKWVDPEDVILGGMTDVTMVVTQTCPLEPLPVDMVLIADQSVSMTRGQPGGIGPGPTMMPTPDPHNTPTVGPPPTPDPDPGGDPGGEREGEPPFCGGGGHDISTLTPSPTPTRWVWRTPTPGLPTRPPTRVPTAVQEYAGDTDQIRAVQQWVRDFVGQPEIERDLANGRLRIGCTSFNRRVVVRSNLSDNGNDCVSAYGRLRGRDITQPQLGFNEAQKLLDGAGSRVHLGEDNRLQVVVLLSDFEFCQKDMRRLNKDVTVMSVGFGVRDFDRAKMYDLASKRIYVSDKHRVRDTVSAYDEDFVLGGRPVGIASLTISDELSDELSILPAAIRPPTGTLNGQLVEWQYAPPTYPITVGYAAEPLTTGPITVSKQSGIAWTDTLGRVGSAPFPEVKINVVAHTATPTPTSTSTFTPTNTPTATMTPTPLPKPIYLPILFKLWPKIIPTPTPTQCKPEEQTVDVAMVIDTSSSMLESTQEGGAQKLQAAIDAALGLVNVMKPEDQMTVIGFNSDATMLTMLTSDKATVTQALNDLPNTSQSGTAINKGLRAGQAELVSERHRQGNSRALILLTDGQQTDPSGVADVRAAADELRAAGITVVTIGIGGEVDAELLQYVATRVELYFHAPRAEDLEAIYHKIAPIIPCG